MRKLSEILKEQLLINKGILTPCSSQSLVLFDNVLDAGKVLQSPEIEKLVTCIYGGYALSIVETDNPEKLHDWLRDEQYKAVVQDRTMIYPIKSPFEELTLDSLDNLFAGPAYALLFTPDGATHTVLTITCRWNDGLFRNDNYVIGAIIDADDLERIVAQDQRI